MRQMFGSVARVLDESPDDVELLHGMVIRQIHEAFPSGSPQPTQDDLMREVYPRVTAAVDASPDHKAALERMAQKYGAAQQAHERAAAGNGAPVRDVILVAIGVGLLLGTIIVGGICLYLGIVY